jgi:hypothetical protein
MYFIEKLSSMEENNIQRIYIHTLAKYYLLRIFVNIKS